MMPLFGRCLSADLTAAPGIVGWPMSWPPAPCVLCPPDPDALMWAAVAVVILGVILGRRKHESPPEPVS